MFKVNGLLKCNRLAVHFKLTLGVIFAVLYKYLNCVAYKAIDAGHTAITVTETINYGKILLLLFITFWWKRWYVPMPFD